MAGVHAEPRPWLIQFQTAILSTATLNALDLMRADSPNQAELKR